MIDPRTQYILYKERENALMLQIERNLAARELGRTIETSQPWYRKTGLWVKELIFPSPTENCECIVEKNPC